MRIRNLTPPCCQANHSWPQNDQSHLDSNFAMCLGHCRMIRDMYIYSRDVPVITIFVLHNICMLPDYTMVLIKSSSRESSPHLHCSSCIWFLSIHRTYANLANIYLSKLVSIIDWVSYDHLNHNRIWYWALIPYSRC